MTKSYITATDLFNYAKCPHRPFMDYYGDPSQKVTIHPLVKLLWESGVQYEAKIIASLKGQHPDKTFCAIWKNEDRSFANAQADNSDTLAAMREGYDYIYQGVLISGDMGGRPDLLVKTNGTSDFGDYHYSPMDIKLARVEDSWSNGDEKPKSDQELQVRFYGGLLEKVQGSRPQCGYIYKTKSRILKIDLSKPNDYYTKSLAALTEYHRNCEAKTEPALCSNCKMCEWKAVCKKQILSTNACSQVYYVGNAMQRGLRLLGIHTVDDLAGQNPDELVANVRQLKSKGYFWKSLSDDAVIKSIVRATVFKSGQPVIHSPIIFPKHPFEIHYDLEDDPTQDFVYLHGLVLAERGKEPEFHAFFAESPDDEKKITEQLFEFLKKYAGAPVYHYSPYEKTTLKRLIAKYPSMDSSVFEMLFGENGTAVDLLRIINDKTDWPLSSYSIKDICRHLGFQWDAEEASGSSSIVWMNDYMNGQKDLKHKILRYNEDDCRASYFLKSTLAEIE
jgi:uncharacterized protein